MQYVQRYALDGREETRDGDPIRVDLPRIREEFLCLLKQIKAPSTKVNIFLNILICGSCFPFLGEVGRLGKANSANLRTAFVAIDIVVSSVHSKRLLL